MYLQYHIVSLCAHLHAYLHYLQYRTTSVCVPTFSTDSLVDKSTSIVITFDSEHTITSDPSLELEFESSTVSSGPVVRSRVCGSRYHSFDAVGICNSCLEKAPHWLAVH